MAKASAQNSYTEHDHDCGIRRIGICSCGLLRVLKREPNPTAVYPEYESERRERDAALQGFQDCKRDK